MNARIVVERCTGCGYCEEVCAAVFEVPGCFARVKVASVPPMEEGLCIDAMWICPAAAIELYDPAGELFADWTSCEDPEAVELGLPSRETMVASCEALLESAELTPTLMAEAQTPWNTDRTAVVSLVRPRRKR